MVYVSNYFLFGSIGRKNFVEKKSLIVPLHFVKKWKI
jgi:hypothetical protein